MLEITAGKCRYLSPLDILSALPMAITGDRMIHSRAAQFVCTFLVAIAIGSSVLSLSPTAHADTTTCAELIITPTDRVTAYFDLLKDRKALHLNKAARSVKLVDRKNWMARRTAVKLFRPTLFRQPSLMVFTPPGYIFTDYATRMLNAQISIRLAELAVHDVLFPRDPREYLLFTSKAMIEEKIKRLTEIESELYQIFSDFKLDTQLLEKSDPGKNWIRRFLFLGRPQRNVGPNVADYNSWLINGESGLNAELLKRYKGMYQTQGPVDSVKRFMTVAIVTGMVAGTPQALEHQEEIYEALSKVSSAASTILTAPDKTHENLVQTRSAEHLEDELRRLKLEIEQIDNAKKRTQLEDELEELLTGL